MYFQWDTDTKNRRNNNSDGRHSPGNDHNDTNPWEMVVKILILQVIHNKCRQLNSSDNNEYSL